MGSFSLRRGRVSLQDSGATAGAILFVRAQKHLFAFTFGTGRFSLDPSSYERYFGLRVTLNAVDPRSLRSVDMQTIEELTLLTRRQASRRSGLEVFQLDEVRDMLRGVVGEPTNPDTALGLAGSDRLAFRARVRFEDLAAKCAEFLALYNAKTYKQNFGFIDHMRRVSEPDVSAGLDAQMLNLLNKRRLANVHLAPPAPVEWEDFGGFRYDPLDRGGQRSDIDVVDFLDAFSKRDDGALELKDLRRKWVVLLSAASGEVTKHWSVYDTIVAELEWGTARYVLSGGDWFEVDKTFAATTAHAIDELAVSDIAFPTSPKGEVERAYLERAIPLLAESEGIGYALLDRELVACAGAPSLLEVCDIFSQLGQFIHVKRRTASATLSHLFTQGTASATVFMNDQAFRQGARAKLPAYGWDHVQLFPDDTPDARDYSVVYAVIAPGQEPLAKILPFLSQVSLTYAARTLRTMGFGLELAHIEETAAPQGVVETVRAALAEPPLRESFWPRHAASAGDAEFGRAARDGVRETKARNEVPASYYSGMGRGTNVCRSKTASGATDLDDVRTLTVAESLRDKYATELPAGYDLVLEFSAQKFHHHIAGREPAMSRAAELTHLPWSAPGN